jgi:hypothetical protein
MGEKAWPVALKHSWVAWDGLYYVLDDSGLLPSLVRRSHIAHYAPAVSLTRAYPNLQGFCYKQYSLL